MISVVRAAGLVGQHMLVKCKYLQGNSSMYMLLPNRLPYVCSTFHMMRDKCAAPVTSVLRHMRKSSHNSFAPSAKMKNSTVI